MSSAENFASRWSRLKREPETVPKVPSPEVEAPRTLEEAEGDAQAGPAAADSEPAFDPGSLPSIESIEVDTDIRDFLRPRVPPELTQAALRRAWASDPAIRDFIGIAENQWDFNDPTSIFGFGPMRATDNVSALLAQAVGNLQDFAGKVIATADSSALAKLDEGANVRPDLVPVTEAPLEAGSGEMFIPVATADDQTAVTEETARRPRRHGGALPQ